ncbi:microcystin-dependent protein [Enterobacter sp. AG5470]|nr:microcystin-dependent protein [Enterobacter sp. AG5470]
MADTKKLQSPDALKARFKAGSIPLQSDFADLIDLANAGAVAAGQAASQTNSAGIGMKYGTTGKLELNVTSSFNFNSDSDKEHAVQLSVDSSNNKPVIDLAYGLIGSSDGLSVKASTGIVVNGNGVSVDAGIIANATAGAKAVGQFTGQDGKPGVGMRITSAGKLEPDIDASDYSQATDNQGVSPIKVDTSTNKLVVDYGNGLIQSTSGLGVKGSTGVVVDVNGVSVNATIIANAQAGAKAVGQFTGQDGKPGLGMRITAAGKLEPNLDPFDFSSVTDGQGVSPIRIDTSTNKMVVDINQGLSASTNGLSVKPSTGIVVNANGVSVAPDTMAYVEAAARGVGKFHGQDGKAGLGMRYSSDGKLEINSNYSGFNYSNEADGSVFIAIDKGTNMPVLDIGPGLTSGTSEVEVRVKASTGIKVDTNGVSVDMAYVVPRGIIVMFSGSAAPSGWAFCNGQNGTPDLRDRFIKGSQNFSTSTGGAKQNSYTPTGKITIDPHTLTVAEMPSHTHRWVKGTGGNMATGTNYPRYDISGTWAWVSYPPYDAFENTGGNQPHYHTGRFDGNIYYQNNEPQYFALAFIMKL